MKKRVLILCTGNSCRSQMAEGLWRHWAGDNWEVFSAGSNPTGFVHPLAITAMKEIGIDISSHTSKHANDYTDQSFDLVVTVCDSAKESCPLFPGAKHAVHWPFEDPASATDSDAEKLRVFTRIRDQIRHRVATYLSERSSGS